MENTCINCGNEISGKFCSNCGQKAGVKRITFREGWEDFWARIYGFDGMMPRTLRDLTINPGKASRAYISGNRAKYYGPVGYFFLMVTLFLLFFDLIGLNIAEFIQKSGQQFSGDQTPMAVEKQKAMEMFFVWVSDNMKLFSFAIIPFYAFFARYFFFRRSGFNYLENMVLPLYITGHGYWLSILAGAVYKFSGSMAAASLQAFVGFIYHIFSYSNFYNYQPVWKRIVKSIMIYLFSFATMMVVGGIVAIVLILLSPEFRDLMRPLK